MRLINGGDCGFITLNKKMPEDYLKVETVLYEAAKGLWEATYVPGYVNLDPLDVRQCMKRNQYGYFISAYGKGGNKFKDIEDSIVECPHTANGLSKAQSIIVTMYASPKMGLADIDEASKGIIKYCSPDCRIVWACCFDHSLEDEMKIHMISFENERLL